MWLLFFSPVAGEGGGSCGGMAAAVLTGWFSITVIVLKCEKERKKKKAIGSKTFLFRNVFRRLYF